MSSNPSMRILPIYADNFLAQASMSLLRLAMPLYLAYLGLKVEGIGLVFTLYAITTALSASLAGELSDRWGRWGAASLGSSCMLSSLALLSLIDAPPLAIAAYLLMGFGIGSFDPAINASIADLLPKKDLGKAYGTLSTTTLGGIAVGPALGGLLIASVGFKATFLYALLLASPILALSLFNLPKDGRGHREKPLGMKLRGWSPQVPIAWTHSFASFFLGSSLHALLPLYALGIGLREEVVGLLFTGMFLVSSLSRGPLGILIDKSGRFLLISTLGLLLAALGMGGSVLFTSALLIFLFLVIHTLGRAMANLATTTLIAFKLNEEERGAGMGMKVAFRQAGNSFGPGITGFLVATLGYQLGFLSSSLLALLGAGSLTLLFCLRRGKGGGSSYSK